VVAFDVPGRPVAFQRPRKRKGGGYHNDAGMMVYRQRVNYFAREAIDGMFTAPVNVEIVLYTWGRGDLDNYAKNILDALKGVAYHDDQAQIRRLVIERVLTPAKADAHAVVKIIEHKN